MAHGSFATLVTSSVLVVFGACSFTFLGCSSNDGSGPDAQASEDWRRHQNAGDAGTADANASDAAQQGDTSLQSDGGGSDAVATNADAGSSANDAGGTVLPTDCTVTRCHYVRSGATGSQDGSDWNNAYSSFHSTLVRGDTYFVAGGNYPEHTFDDPESGAAIITIKKALASDHGTDTGWQSSYGSSQAIFNSILRFDTGYYVFDGQTRNEGNWFDGASYGFQVYHNNTQNQNIIIGATSSKVATNVVISRVYINAPYQTVSSTTTIAQRAVDTDTWADAAHTGLLFTHMYVRGGNNIWFLRNTDSAIIEYSASEGATSTSANHGEIVNLYYTGANATVRYNQWRDEFIGYGGTALVAITNPHNETANGLSFYGNVAWDFETGDAAIGFAGYQSNNNKVYNNTFIRGVGYNSGTAWGSGTGNLVYNNMYVGCTTVNLDGTHDYNAFSDSNARGETHAQTNVPTSIFTDYSGSIFTLTGGTNAGLTLPAPYTYDLPGNLRGADGTWDRGAFEWK